MKVAILGYGQEGEANYRYWSKMGADLTIVDEADHPTMPLPENAKTILGKDALSSLKGFDLVVRTASFNPNKIHTDGKVWSATREFISRSPAPVIGVTGTKGKGTTCSFITEILNATGIKAHLVGNIGKPALDELPKIQENDVVVYELSSFQLWDLKASPHVAVVLMIEPDHLEVHSSMEEYVQAKGNITRWQRSSDIAVYYPENQYSKQIGGMSPGSQIPYTRAPGAYVKDGFFYMDEQKLCSTETVVIPGKHNLDNACASISAAWQYTHDTDAIAKGLNNFKGLPHRLSLVSEINGVKYYDDSIATTSGSAIAAINAFDEPKILILGGSDKGTSYEELVKKVATTDSVKGVVCIGETGPKIAYILHNSGFQNIELLKNVKMPEIVSKAAEMAEPGDVVILSPASASFGMFKNYKDRGDQFIESVKSLAGM